jgi:hypothetical protein
MAKRKWVKCFTVSFKDLSDKSKNPNFSLSVKDILNNPKISKKELKNGNKSK